MNAHDYARQVLDQVENIRHVYWVACGGSVIDLYPAHCLINASSPSMTSAIHTAAEFCALPPAALGRDSLVVTCSHSGGTPETIEATRLGRDRGAFVLAMTNRPGSAIDTGEWPCWAYQWEDDTPQSERPAGFSLALAADLMAAQDGYEGVDALSQGLCQLEPGHRRPPAARQADLGPRFVEMCREHDFFYVLGSGPTFCQTYGLAICSLMEMQWQNCSYVNSAEYFHGPFECTQDGVFYLLQKSAGASRHIDERAEPAFLSSPHRLSPPIPRLGSTGAGEREESIAPSAGPISTAARPTWP